MKKILSLSFLMFLALALSPAYGQASDNEALKNDLQASYAVLQKALADKNLKAYMEAKVPHPDSESVTNEEFLAALDILKGMYPPMAPDKFLVIKTVGNQAGYYYQGSEDGPGFVTTALIKFEKVKDQWKVGDVASSSEEAQAGVEKKTQSLKLIDTSESLKLK